VRSPIGSLRAALAALLLLAALPAGASEPYVSRARFSELAKEASTDAFRVPDDPVVWAALNKLIDEPGKREWARRSLTIREVYREEVEAAIEEAGLPHQLAAIPLIEAGYRNLGSDDPIDQVPYKLGPVGRGLWMFVRNTGRAFGLQIDDEIDERLDVAASSAAAMVYLAKLHDRFGSWGLTFAAYHRGSSTVKKAIAEEGVRSTWRLIERGALTRYAAKIMAAAVILHEPGLVGWEPEAEAERAVPPPTGAL
jgi:membrane-bound lytic murein transglycosylase D